MNTSDFLKCMSFANIPQSLYHLPPEGMVTQKISQNTMCDRNEKKIITLFYSPLK